MAVRRVVTGNADGRSRVTSDDVTRTTWCDVTRRVGIVVAVVVGVVLGAASSVPGAVLRASWSKPCAIVATSEVQAITGSTIARTKTNSGPVAACLYYEASSPEAVVGIWLNGHPLTGTASNQYAFDSRQAQKNSVNENFQTVRGVGNKAFFFESEIFNRMEVLVGKRLFHVDGSQLTVDQMEKLARAVVAKS